MRGTMWVPTALLSVLSLAAASPVGSLRRRVNKEVVFGTGQSFTLQPSNSPVVSLWGGVDTYFQGDGNFVVLVLPQLLSLPTFIHSLLHSDCR